jgi:formylglycine-generating enzyme required for sulfatase activity
MAAVSSNVASGARVLVREPTGPREYSESVSVGGTGAHVVVPGAPAGVALVIERHAEDWRATPAPGAALRLNGETLEETHELRAGDSLALGDAHVVVADVARGQLSLDVRHLAGNATLPPVAFDPTRESATGDDDLEIQAGAAPLPVRQTAAASAGSRRFAVGAALAAAAAVSLAVLLLIAALEPVVLDVLPSDARVRSADTLLSWHSGDTLFVLPGAHRIRAEHPEYRSVERRITVADGEASVVRLRLARLPGKLEIETGGVPATVSVNGAQVGRAPGVVEAPAGRQTLTIRAPRYLDRILELDVAGGGRAQIVEVRLEPAWGTLEVSSEPEGAIVSVDDRAMGPSPRSLELDAGVHRLRLAAPGYKTWESSVLVRAGETQAIGPIALGAPDARLVVRSQPSGSQVLVGGAYRGRTPLELDLPSGIDYDVAVTRPGHSSFERRLFAEPGARTAIDARLTPMIGKVTVSGEPAGAEVLIAGERRGAAPLTLELGAGEHRLEIRREGFETQAVTVMADAKLPRTIEYRLLPRDRALAALQTAPTTTTRSGYALRLVPGGAFEMGSGRREQGRRPNETLRRVTLARPFYLGTREVTNAEFRRFRPQHASGYIGSRTFDLDAQPAVQVSWEDAAEFCNWLSEQEGLAPAYEKRDGKLVLKTPIGNGFRLPTEAEWEYAARFAQPGRTRRFAWGDVLPVPSQAGNIAGAESQELIETSLASYRDDFIITAPVASFATNALGMHDMEGNVHEWTNDLYSSFTDPSPATDPLGPAEGQRHVVRGPSWRTANVSELRLAWREGGADKSDAVGFRVARYLDPS